MFKKGYTPWNKNKKGIYSKEHLNKLRIAHMGNKYSLGHPSWNKGKHWSEESKEKMRQAHLGEKNRLYIKDRSKLKKSEDRRVDTTWKMIRKKVYERDNWKCKMLSHECKGRIEAHHIFSWKDYPELRYLMSNLITLCVFHHPHWRKEDTMRDIFQELIR
jgi:5-methylcytosine-specific restriction endonuclease McrA